MIGQLAVDAAQAWGPLGWLYRNTPGNVAASVIWAGPPFVGVVIGKNRAAKKDAHDHWTSVHLARLAEAAAVTLDDHPQHGRLATNPKEQP